MKKRIIFVILFWGLLLFPTLNVILSADKTFSENENRTMQTAPECSIFAILSGDYQSKVTDYCNDQFVGRDLFMKAATMIKKGVGYRDIGGAYVGYDNYYLEKITDKDINVEQYEKNLNLISQFTQNNQELKATLLLVPTAASVLSEKLPAYAESYDAGKLIRTASESLENVNVPNLYKELKKNQDQYIYYRTDHHWTTLGAELAYDFLSQQTDGRKTELTMFSDKFLGTTYSKTLDYKAQYDTIDLPQVSDDVTVTYNGNQIPFYDRSVKQEKDKYKVFFGGNYSMLKINGGASNGKTLFVLKDSFSNSMVPFLTKDYENIIMVDLRYFGGSIKQLMADETVDEILMIYEMSNLANDKNLVKLIM